MVTMKKIIKRMDEMCAPAYFILKICFMVSSALLLAAIVIIASSGGFSVHTYYMYALAGELLSMPTAIMLIAIIGSTYIEEKSAK